MLDRELEARRLLQDHSPALPELLSAGRAVPPKPRDPATAPRPPRRHHLRQRLRRLV
jgi:hypothetical protein